MGSANCTQKGTIQMVGQPTRWFGGTRRSDCRGHHRHEGVGGGRTQSAARPRRSMVQSILAIAFAEAIVFYALFLVK